LRARSRRAPRAAAKHIALSNETAWRENQYQSGIEGVVKA
jgi:hypothetical protein